MTDFIAQHENALLEQLFDWLRIPSISADPAYNDRTKEAALWLKNMLEKSGADCVEIWPTAGHDVVFAEKIVDPSLPTLLVYGHYDVQPADPVELWTNAPFEPVIRDGKIYGRGTSDDKGQSFLHVAALNILHQQGAIPCNLKFVIEGEEEVGSPNLADVIRANRERLTCDAIVISDTSMLATDTPSLTVALRGLSYVEVELRGFNRDLHSGVYGGVVDNPINALCGMIAKLKDENGHVTIPGFYDDVVEHDDAARAELNKRPFDAVKYAAEIGAPALFGEAGFTNVERIGIRPCLDVNGIWGGYTGEGSKTVLPAAAFAKISMRLAANQDYHKATRQLSDYMHSICPKTMALTVKPHHGGEPVLTDINGAAYRAAAEAVAEIWGKTPIPAYEGASIPISAMLQRELSPQLVFLGFGLDSDAIHSPDEHFRLDHFQKGLRTVITFYKNFGKMAR